MFTIFVAESLTEEPRLYVENKILNLIVQKYGVSMWTGCRWSRK
jgi:hypothetical protein